MIDVERANTARALREEPLFATRQWWCRLGIHTWLMWSEPYRRGYYFEQFRTCGCCGKSERRLISKD